MKRAFVRLVSLSINNIKNVLNGSIQFHKLNKEGNYVINNSVMGIYGQNVSGKTAVVDAMKLLQDSLKGEIFHKSLYKYITYAQKESRLRYQFYIEIEDKKYDLEYSFSLRVLEEGKIVLSNEMLYGTKYIDGKWTRKECFLEYNIDEKETLFKPNDRNADLMADIDKFIQAKVAQQLTQGYDEDKKQWFTRSLFFSKQMNGVFSSIESFRELYELIQSLKTYAKEELIVIQNEHFGLIDLNLSNLVFYVNMKEEGTHVTGRLPINVEGKTILPAIVFDSFSKVIEQTNRVIQELVPDVLLNISNIEKKYTEEGEKGLSFELVTKRGESVIPFECESAGIKKLISICTALIACYNRSSVCLVIDEFDSGIFEYLLGQLLEIMQEYAKGQLIFTSHNLRALEVLDDDSLIFTTLNPEDRYSNLHSAKNIENKRLSYLRTIYLGEEDKFYKRTSQAKIKRAFKKSGR